VAVWTQTKTETGEPHWLAVAEFVRRAGLDAGQEPLEHAAERLRQLVYRMMRDVAGISFSGKRTKLPERISSGLKM
jgi:hypothetical protein